MKKKSLTILYALTPHFTQCLSLLRDACSRHLSLLDGCYCTVLKSNNSPSALVIFNCSLLLSQSERNNWKLALTYVLLYSQKHRKGRAMLSSKVSHGLGLRDWWLSLWGWGVPDKVLLDTLLPEALGTLKNVSITSLLMCSVDFMMTSWRPRRIMGRFLWFWPNRALHLGTDYQ